MTINSQTAVCGIIGKPVRHSLSPIIHNAAAKHCKVNAVFVAFESDDYKGAIRAMRALNIRELTITMPYKELIIPYLDSIEKQAEIVHNVNTVINTNGHIYDKTSNFLIISSAIFSPSPVDVSQTMLDTA